MKIINNKQLRLLLLVIFFLGMTNLKAQNTVTFDSLDFNGVTSGIFIPTAPNFIMPNSDSNDYYFYEKKDSRKVIYEIRSIHN